MSVGAPTDTAYVTRWEPVHRDGKLLFEYDPANCRIRLRRWGRVFVVDLAPLRSEPLMHDAQLKQ